MGHFTMARISSLEKKAILEPESLGQTVEILNLLYNDVEKFISLAAHLWP
jgi:hypothetical protein